MRFNVKAWDEFWRQAFRNFIRRKKPARKLYPKRGKKLCSVCGKLVTVRVNGTLIQHRCAEAEAIMEQIADLDGE